MEYQARTTRPSADPQTRSEQQTNAVEAVSRGTRPGWKAGPAMRGGTRQVPVAGLIRRMKIDGTAQSATVSGTTRKKHVVPLAAQAAAAQAEFGPLTLVTDEQTLIDAVNANAHDFPSGAQASARFDIQATVKIYLWEKTEAPPAGYAKGKPSAKTIDGVDTLCEIGAIKTGDGRISITHFKKL